MKLWQRYKKLNVWNKTAFWGSVCSIIGVIYLFLPSETQKNGVIQNTHSPNTGDQNAINNSSNVSVKNNSDNFNQNIGPNNNAPIVNVDKSPGTMVQVGITHDDIEIIKAGMREAEKKNKDLLNTLFPEGYVVFSAKEGNQIVPLPRSPDNNFSIANWHNCYVGYENDNIKIFPPAIIYRSVQFDNNTIYLKLPLVIGAPYNIGFGFVGPKNLRHELVMFLDTNADSLTVAVGVH